MKNFISGTNSLLSKYSKNVSLEELLRHRTIVHKNLYESVGQYPNNGIGFKIWRNNWPVDCFYVLSEVQFKGLRSGKAWGELTWRGRKVEKRFRIRGTKKRGLWKYEVNGTSASLDNSVNYSTAELELFPGGACARDKLSKQGNEAEAN